MGFGRQCMHDLPAGGARLDHGEGVRSCHVVDVHVARGRGRAAGVVRAVHQLARQADHLALDVPCRMERQKARLHARELRCHMCRTQRQAWCCWAKYLSCAPGIRCSKRAGRTERIAHSAACLKQKVPRGPTWRGPLHDGRQDGHQRPPALRLGNLVRPPLRQQLAPGPSAAPTHKSELEPLDPSVDTCLFLCSQGPLRTTACHLSGWTNTGLGGTHAPSQLRARERTTITTQGAPRLW